MEMLHLFVPGLRGKIASSSRLFDGGQGGLNLPLPVAFIPVSASLHFFDCEILHNVA